MNESASEPAVRRKLADFVVLGVSWGIVGGLITSLLRFLLQTFGLATFDSRQTAVTPRLLWVSALTFAVLWAVVGIGFAFLQARFRRIDFSRVAMIVFGVLTAYDMVSAIGRFTRVATVLLSLGLGVTVNRILPGGGPPRNLRRALPWLALIALIVGVGVEVTTRVQERRAIEALPPAAANAPNVLLVIVDTLRADRVSSYGYGKPTTPGLTRLAEQGVQFNWAFAGSSWSLPSHVSILTGRYPSEHGAEIERYDGRFPLISQAFLERGYRTAAISANSIVFSRAWGFDRGFLRFDDSFYSVVDGFTRTYPGRQIHRAVKFLLGWRSHPVKRPADAVTRAAERWIDDRGKRPFFLVLNYFDVHDPEPPVPPLDGNAYDGEVAYVDRALKDLVQYLDENKLAENTVVVVTSDHGESMGEHKMRGHGNSLYVDQIHVPLILRFPPSVPAGIRVQTPVSHTSLAATLLELAGGTTGTTQIPGRSLSPLWKSSVPVTDWPIPRADVRKQPSGLVALHSVMDVPWHFVRSSEGHDELFNLDQDAAETNNLAGLAEYAPLVMKYGDLIQLNSPELRAPSVPAH